MSFSIGQNGSYKAYGLQHFIIDSPLDIPHLPKSDVIPGSTAFCISNSEQYMLNHRMNWEKIVTNSGSSGGGGGDIIPEPGTTVIYDGGVISNG